MAFVYAATLVFYFAFHVSSEAILFCFSMVSLGNDVMAQTSHETLVKLYRVVVGAPVAEVREVCDSPLRGLVDYY